MKILFATSEEFIAPSILNYTSLLLPYQVTQDKVSNLLIFVIVSRLIAVELEDKNEETNASTLPVLWLPIKMILKLTRLGPTVLCYSCIGHVLLTTVPVTKDGSTVRYGTQVRYGTLHFLANSTVRLYGT